jgi:malate dehydrogenase
MRDWLYGSDEWQSMGVKSDKYKGIIPEGLVVSMPVTTKDGKHQVVGGIKFDDE